MKHEPNINSLLRNTKIADAFRRWLCEDGDTLVAAADLLGGPNWARRASTVVTCARNGGDLHTHRQTLARLAKLLRLEFVDDLSRPEAARFVALHPDDPRATDAMVCADAVLKGRRALEALWLAGIPGHGHGEEVQ
ncbi:hypothetical protein [Roseovarius indicus]|uniref:Uncharacterized protein n=1 Tax=Roseovarius indicus TaxID=540747 RepID=A0A0T5PD35_9RHOB|nr:hypothetical protein [Roseovarius indicus]KRS18954.1 hypothetical protein XM52_04575 [Roseovarius indicus]QEW26114.1 hypothetical protein RIdsm_01908 [Roseovarius indicus]